MSNRERGSNDGEADHLADLPDGSGCFEIWDHLSGVREATAGD